jgi:hypothetical protein
MICDFWTILDLNNERFTKIIKDKVLRSLSRPAV